MRLLAATVAALALAVGLEGCGSSLAGAYAPETVTIELPTGRPADATVPVQQAQTSGRRVLAGPTTSAGALTNPAFNPTTSAGGPTNAAVGPTGALALTSLASGSIPTPLSSTASAGLNGVNVWIPYWNLSAAVASAVDHAGIVRVAHPFLYQLSNSNLLVDQSGGAGPAVIGELAAAHLEVIPTVTETQYMGGFLSTLTHRRRALELLHTLTALADQPGVNGLDLDFENLAVGNSDALQTARLAELYPRFVGRLCVRLHAAGRSCEVTVMAKNTAGQLGSGGLDTSVYDLAALARVADRVQIMAYDDHVPSGAPGPVAPWPWVESVIGYALTQIPAAKIVLGVPAYGYEWSSDGNNASVTAISAQALAARHHVPVRWNTADAEPFFSFTTGRRRHRVHHLVWFDDATANYDRAVLAADNRLAGIDLWAAGDETPSTWTMLARLPGA